MRAPAIVVRSAAGSLHAPHAVLNFEKPPNVVNSSKIAAPAAVRHDRPLQEHYSHPIEVSQSAFIVAVPEAEGRVDSLRRRFDPSARLGVPAHVTVLYPFMSPELIGAAVLAEIGLAFADSVPFRFSLSRVARFADAVYLAPEPTAPFVRLTEATACAGRFF